MAGGSDVGDVEDEAGVDGVGDGDGAGCVGVGVGWPSVR